MTDNSAEFQTNLDIALPNIQYGIFKSRADRFPTGSGLTVVPDVVPLPDDPRRFGQGHNVPVDKSWYDHLQLVNGPEEFEYLWTVDVFWCNVLSWDGVLPMPSESISSGGNFFAYDRETPTHHHMLAFPYNMDTRVLNPVVHNWYRMPWMFPKVSCIDENGRKFNPTDGIDVYFVHLKLTDRWVAREDCEPFPRLPFTVAYGGESVRVVRYRLLGASVIGVTDTNRHIWLCKSTEPGERIFPTTWRLSSPGVIPPPAS